MDAADVARISLFAGLTEAECARIAGLFTEDRVIPGRRLAMQGDFGYRFFVILEGTAIVRVDDQQVASLGPGDFFGEIALLGGEGRRSAEVEATSRMHYGSMMIWDFRQLVEELPGIGAKVEAAIAEHRLRDEENAARRDS